MNFKAIGIYIVKFFVIGLVLTLIFELSQNVMMYQYSRMMFRGAGLWPTLRGLLNISLNVLLEGALGKFVLEFTLNTGKK